MGHGAVTGGCGALAEFGKRQGPSEELLEDVALGAALAPSDAVGLAQPPPPLCRSWTPLPIAKCHGARLINASAPIEGHGFVARQPRLETLELRGSKLVPVTEAKQIRPIAIAWTTTHAAAQHPSQTTTGEGQDQLAIRIPFARHPVVTHE
jgi:hypothetical protein